MGRAVGHPAHRRHRRPSRGVPAARHAKGHTLSPSEINYRANIDVLKRAGVTDLVSLSACGSFQGRDAAGDLRAGRPVRRPHLWPPSSFFGRGCVAPCLDGPSGVAAPAPAGITAAAEAEDTRDPRAMGPMSASRGRNSRRSPRASTYKGLGYAVIGMTNMPEAKLAREAEICYATVAMVTDFDCWHPDHDAVTVQDVVKVLFANADRAKRLVARLAKDFPREHEACPIGSDRALDHAIITAPDARDPGSWRSSMPWRGACSPPLRGRNEGADEMMTSPELEFDLKASIRTIPDYPKPGIMFRDITTLLGNARAFRRAVDELVQPWAGMKIAKVAGIEARGFILGGAVAHQVSAGFVPIRKKGKLPHKRVSIAYSLEYGLDEMEMHEDAVEPGDRVILVDDLIATGGTAEGAVKLLRKLGADILAACFIIDLPDLGGAAKLRALDVPVRTLITFEGH